MIYLSVAIHFHQVIKKFGDNTVIPKLSLDIQGGEFFTLLGPSGCGKTTLLRMIIGFNSIEGGTIAFNDRVINDVHPSKRNIGMVFQNYAIFPHMTVAENVAFGLENRKVPKSEIERRVDEILKVVQIDGLKNRLPQNMSGGQQQRVALARAIVVRPDVLLMDEPLSNLDAKLRVEMRTAIKEIHDALGITTVYVTHDQEEALAISDRIAVMNKGEIQYVGTPKEVYQRPSNTFVSTFIGRSNLLDGKLDVAGNVPVLRMDDGYEAQMENILPEYRREQNVKISVRPEELYISPDDTGLRAVIASSMFLGLNTHYFVRLSNGGLAEMIQQSGLDSILPKGKEIRLGVDARKINVFTADGSKNLLDGVMRHGG